MQNNLVTQSNELLNASYSLTLNERRVLLACISQLDSRAEFSSTTPVFLNVNDAHDLFFDEQTAKDTFKQMVQATKQLQTRLAVLFWDDDNSKEMNTYFVQTIKIDHKKRELELYFAIGILPYLTQLKNNFTSYKLMNISRLTSVHAMRVYELIVQWSCQTSTAHYKEMEVLEFKILLGLENKYKKITDLKNRVLDVCIEQINKNTDFELEIKLKKYTSSFDHIQFFYNKKSEPKAVQEVQQIQSIVPTKDLDTKDMFNNLSDRQIEYLLNHHDFQSKYSKSGSGESMPEFRGRVKHLLITRPENFSDLADYLT